MIGYSIQNILCVLWLIYLHLESIFFFFYNKIWFITFEKKKRLLNNNLNLANYNISSLISVSLFFITFFFFKILCKSNNIIFIYNILNIIFIFFVLLLYFNNYIIINTKYSNYYINFIFYLLILFLFLLVFNSNLLIFLFILELISVVYYFFFLDNTYNKLSIKQYKNFILFFLWNSFFTTLLYGFGCCIISFNVGTINFYELSFFSINNFWFGYLWIIIAFFFKLGIPGFHFFKIKLYQYLSSIMIFYFSIVTLIVNLFLFLFFIYQGITIQFFLLTKYLFFLLFFLFFIFIYVYNISNIYTFLSISSIITITTLLIILIVNSCLFY